MFRRDTLDSAADLRAAQIDHPWDHRGLGRHFMAIAPNGGSARGY
jgi:hypothetical protein